MDFKQRVRTYLIRKQRLLAYPEGIALAGVLREFSFDRLKEWMLFFSYYMLYICQSKGIHRGTVHDETGNLILTCHTSKMNCSKLLTNDETPMVLRNARLRINGLSVGTWDDELDPNRLRVNIVELLMPVFRTMRLRGNGRSTRGQ